MKAGWRKARFGRTCSRGMPTWMGSLGAISKMYGFCASGEPVKAKADAVFHLSEMVKVHLDVILRSLRAHVTRFHQVPSLLREGTTAATSANLRLAFTTEHFLSGKLCVGVRAAGKGIPMPLTSLCFGSPRRWFLQLGSPHQEEKRTAGW